MARKKSEPAVRAQHPDSQAWLNQWQDWINLYGTSKDGGRGFESALEVLEDSAPLLERTDLPLDDLLQIYEKSVDTARRLQQILASARQRMDSLAQTNDEEVGDDVDD